MGGLRCVTLCTQVGMATDLNVLCRLHEHVHHELPNVAGHHTACSKMCAVSNQW